MQTASRSFGKPLSEGLLATPTPFEGGLLRSVRVRLEHMFTLSVARTLNEHSPRLPDAYVRQLVDSGVRVLLLPQFRAITQHKLTYHHRECHCCPANQYGQDTPGRTLARCGCSSNPGLYATWRLMWRAADRWRNHSKNISQPPLGYIRCLVDFASQKLLRWLVPRKSFECDQNLWDAVGVGHGRTLGVESHRTLGDHR